MKCPKCHTEFTTQPKYCGECGSKMPSGAHIPPSFPRAESAAKGDLDAGRPGDRALKPPSGFGRTLSTELLERQMALRTSLRLNALLKIRTYAPGEVMIRQGDSQRDLMCLTEGIVEISKKEGNGKLILNEVDPPNILGEIAFLSGLPRTATAIAKTEVKTYELNYQELKDLFGDLPRWLPPLLTSMASGIKALHHKVKTLERKISDLEAQMGDQPQKARHGTSTHRV